MELIKDIISELRAFGTTPPPRGAWDDIADRLEAAWTEEVVVSKNATTTKESLGVGNTEKMREALKQIKAYASSHGLWHIEVMAGTALENAREEKQDACNS